MIKIRESSIDDLESIMEIYAGAKRFMEETGNPNQWTEGYPSRELVADDIYAGRSFVCVDDDGIIAGTFCFAVEADPTYESIIGGQWLDDAPYGVIHRLASGGRGRGIADSCIGWCFARHGNLRADTHRDNIIMRRILARNGFQECGTIYTRHSPRIAFQKID